MYLNSQQVQHFSFLAPKVSSPDYIFRVMSMTDGHFAQSRGNILTNVSYKKASQPCTIFRTDFRGLASLRTRMAPSQHHIVCAASISTAALFRRTEYATLHTFV